MWADGPDIDPGVIGEPVPRRWPTYILAALQRSGLVKEAPSQAVSYVLLEDEIKRTPAAYHVRVGSGCSSITSESSASGGEVSPFNVWSHLVREEDDDGFPAMGDGMPERGKKGVSKGPRTVDA